MTPARALRTATSSTGAITSSRARATFARMDYSMYYVVPTAHRASVTKLFEEHRVIDDGKFLIVISDDEKALMKLDVVLDFHNDEWSAWGFTLLAKGKQIAHGLFGENAESGVSYEDN